MKLYIQVEEQAKLLGKGLPFKTALVVGGDLMAGQLHCIQQGVGVIIGTPGRLIDLPTKYDIELDGVSILVLDEVDCMLQRGFHEQVMQIFRALSRPQVLMYSATIPKEVEKMASSMVKDIIAISHFMPPVVVFVGSRLGADLLSQAVTVTTGVKAISIHGEKPMKERREILRSFLVGEVPVIVATGVLGRGVDLLGVRQVIVFDMPNSIKEYVHQIGRASRLGEEVARLPPLTDELYLSSTVTLRVIYLSEGPRFKLCGFYLCLKKAESVWREFLHIVSLKGASRTTILGQSFENQTMDWAKT
ncbi:unnamed protein product [Camellia sinensis]